MSSLKLSTGEEQYLGLCKRIVEENNLSFNERTGKHVYEVFGANLRYDVGGGEFPLCTTRQSYWKAAVAEILGYIRGYTSAEDFRNLGTKTWDANANENEAWLNNPNRKGTDDMGEVYGYFLHNWPSSTHGTVNQLEKVYNNLKQGKDDRGEILMMYNPGELDKGCLRPCMYSHTFSLVGGQLNIHSVQRSADVPLGLNFNMVQVYVLLALMAQITQNKAGDALHTITNAHVYDDQMELLVGSQLQRTPYAPPKLWINPEIQSLDDVMTWVTLDDFRVDDYIYHPPINYPFAV